MVGGLAQQPFARGGIRSKELWPPLLLAFQIVSADGQTRAMSSIGLFGDNADGVGAVCLEDRFAHAAMIAPTWRGRNACQRGRISS